MEKQGSAVMRIVAIAVAIAIVIGFFSVMFQVTASAESTNKDIKTGSFSVSGYFDGYPCLNLGTELSFYDFVKNYNTFGYGFCVIPIVIKNNVTYYYKANTSWNCYGYIDVYTATSSNGGTIFYAGTNFYPNSLASDNGESYKKYKTVIKQASSGDGLVYVRYEYYDSKKEWVLDSTEFSVDFYDYKSNTYATNILPSDIKYVLVSNQSRFLQNKNRNNNWSDLDTIFSDNATFTDAGSSPSAKFITCASFTNSDGSFPLWVKDFIAEGHQYPMFTFAISDNGNNHKYSLVLSYNDNDLIAPFIVGMYDELSDSDKRTGFKLTTAISKKFHVSGFVGITNMSDVLKKGCINIFEKNWVNLNYNRAFNLNSSDMDFTDTTGNKVYTITLSDYSAIKANTFYKAELIDLTTSEVLDVTYFTSAQSFNKSDSGNGTKIYDYGDKYDQMWDDLKNNTPSVDPSKGDNFNVGGDVDTNFDNLSNLNINDIISGLRTSISSVSVFFQACWSLFPAAFWSIILLGVSLIIILRILGR